MEASRRSGSAIQYQGGRHLDRASFEGRTNAIRNPMRISGVVLMLLNFVVYFALYRFALQRRRRIDERNTSIISTTTSTIKQSNPLEGSVVTITAKPDSTSEEKWEIVRSTDNVTISPSPEGVAMDQNKSNCGGPNAHQGCFTLLSRLDMSLWTARDNIPSTSITSKTHNCHGCDDTQIMYSSNSDSMERGQIGKNHKESNNGIKWENVSSWWPQEKNLVVVPNDNLPLKDAPVYSQSLMGNPTKDSNTVSNITPPLNANERLSPMDDNVWVPFPMCWPPVLTSTDVQYNHSCSKKDDAAVDSNHSTIHGMLSDDSSMGEDLQKIITNDLD